MASRVRHHENFPCINGLVPENWFAKLEFANKEMKQICWNLIDKNQLNLRDCSGNIVVSKIDQPETEDTSLSISSKKRTAHKGSEFIIMHRRRLLEKFRAPDNNDKENKSDNKLLKIQKNTENGDIGKSKFKTVKRKISVL